ncbi:MAG: HEAT repeat domain-containing protein, partial [Planctomycetes bacterium]|nr:HEAT repeat domain-containing protein [Planctomycetota bacterium]
AAPPGSSATGARPAHQAPSPAAVAAFTPGQQAVHRAEGWLRAEPESLLAPELARDLLVTLETLLLDQEAALAGQLVARLAGNFSHRLAQTRALAAETYLVFVEKATRLIKDFLLPRSLGPIVEALRAETNVSVFGKLVDLAAELARDFIGGRNYEPAKRLVWALGKQRAGPVLSAPELRKLNDEVLRQLVEGEPGDQLIRDLKSVEEATQSLAVQVITGFGRAATRRLVNAIMETEEYPMRKAFALILRELGDEAKGELARELNPFAPTDKYARILEVLDTVSSSVESEALAALRHRDEKVRKEAINLLRRLPRDRAVKLLSRILQDDDPTIATAGVAVLGELRYRDLTDSLARILDMAKDEKLLRETCVAAAKVNDERVVPALGRTLGRTGVLGFWGGAHEDLRAAAAWALGTYFTNAEARAFLERAANDKSPAVRSAAKMGLRQAPGGPPTAPGRG